MRGRECKGEKSVKEKLECCNNSLHGIRLMEGVGSGWTLSSILKIPS